MSGLKPAFKKFMNIMNVKEELSPYTHYLLRKIYGLLEDVYSVSSVTELQRAIDSIGTGAGTIFLTSGTHVVDTPIDIDNCGSLVIYGHGDNTILEAAAGTTIFNITCCQSLLIKTIKLDINNYNFLSPNTQAVIVNETNNNVVLFEDVTIDGDGTNGYGIELQSNNCYIDQCNITNCKKGIYINGSDRHTISSNIITGHADYGIHADGGNYLTIASNTCGSNGDYGINLNTVLYSNIGNNICNLNLMGIYVLNSTNNSISNNICNQNSENGIYITGSSYNTLSGNTCENNDSNTANDQAGMFITNNSSFNTISGNSLNNNNNIGAGEGYGLIIATNTCEENVVASNNANGNDIDWKDAGARTVIKYYVQSQDELQDAIDSIGTGAGTVIITVGTLSITATINILGGGDYVITGEGVGSLLETVGDITCFNVTSAKSCVLKDFKIDASSLTALLKEIINIDEGSNNKIICQNLVITGDGTHGLGVSLSSDNCRVANCFFEKIKAGVFTSNSANNIISENTCKNCDNGINNYFGSDCIITGNVCINNTIGIFNDRSTDSTIVENTCNHNSRYGIFNYGSSDCTITGNACNGNNLDDVSDGGGIHLTDDSDHNIISGNSCNNNANAGAGTAYGINIDTVDCNNNIIGVNSKQNNDVDYNDTGTGTVLFGDNTIYGISWDNDLGTATKNAIYDKIQAVIAGVAANAFKTINTPAGTNPIADAVDDTLNITATGDITITGNAGTDTVDFSVTKYTNIEAVAAIVAENPLALTNSLKIGGNDILDFGDNVILSSNGLGVIDALGNLSCNIVFTGAQTVDGVDISSIVAFKTITGITNDVVADSLTDTLTLQSANAGLTIVGTTATDTITFTNTITQYTDVLAKAAVATDDKYIKNYENDGTTGNLTVANLITVGLVDGVDVSDLKDDVDGFNDELKFLTQVEIQQLENIGAEAISAAEWGFVATLQNVASGASPTFNRITINNIGTVNSDAVRYDQMMSLVGGLNWQESIIDNDLTDPPGGEGVGDRYVVAAVAGGAWTGHEDDIAEYNGAGWDFTAPEEGFTVWVVDEDTNFTYNGVAWVEFGSTISHNNTTGLQGGAPGEYNHLTDVQHGALHTKYTNVEAVNAVAAADDYIKNDANDVMNGDLTVNNIITAGSVDGVDISAISITNMPTAVNDWKMYATNGAGVMTELAVGDAGQFLIGNGAAAAPSFQAQPAPIAHTHDTDTLQLDGINSNLGAFPFTTAGTVTFNQAVIIQGLLTADGVVPEGDLVDSLGTNVLTWLDLFVQDIKDAAGNVILSNDGAGNIDTLANLSCNIVFTGAQTIDGVDVSSIVAFKTITGITNDVVADSLTDTLELAAVGGLTIVGDAVNDKITFTNTITQYVDADAVAAVEAAGLDFDTTKTLGFVDDVAGVFVDRIYDEDNMASDDEHGLITQQSAKKYTDDRLYDINFSHNWGGITDKAPTVDKVYDQFIEVANEMTAIKYCLNFEGEWDATGGAAPDPAPADGDYWIVTTAGVWDAVTWELLDWIVWENNSEKWYKVKYFRDLPRVSVKPTESIQLAIDKIVYMGGGTVFLSAGTHTLTEPLTINNVNVIISIKGLGDVSVIDVGGNWDGFQITNCVSCVLENFKMDITDYTELGTYAININETNDHIVMIKGITIIGDGTNGYGVYSLSNNCVYDSCHISDCYIGLYNDGNNAKFINNIINNMGDTGLGNVNNGDYSLILGNTITECVNVAILVDDSDYVIVSNNSISNLTNYAILINNSDYVIVIGNNISDITMDIGANNGAISMTGIPDYCVISSNIIYNVTNNAVGFDGYGIKQSGTDTHILGNIIFNCDGNIFGAGYRLFGDNTVYGAGWNGDLGTATKHTIWTKIEAIIAGIPAAANAFKTITGITNDVVADAVADTLELAAVGGLTIVGDAVNDKITFTNTITQYTNAMVDARIVVQNTDPAGTIDIAIDALLTANADGYIKTVLEDTTPQLGGDLDLNEHNIVMNIALDADGESEGIIRTMTVDENTFGFGGLLHLQADGHYDDANNSAIGDMPCSAIAVEAGTGSKKVMFFGFIRDDTWNFTVGEPVIVGDNGTAISLAALDVGDYTQIVGIALSADSMLFNPALDYVKRKA